MRRGRPPYPGLLTPREQEVLDLLRQGLTNRQIADRLHVSVATANYHVSQILSKLGVTTREEAAALAPRARGRGRYWLPAIFGTALHKLPVPAAARLLAGGALATAAIALSLLAFAVFTMDRRDLETPASSLPERPLGKLVYVDDGDLWTLELPDGKPNRLTHDGRAFAPQWSASGDWLLYQKVTERQPPEFWVVSADGAEVRRLDATFARWSPVDDRLAYLAMDGSLVVERPDAGGQTTVYDAQARPVRIEGHFAWSPDGAWLAVPVAIRRTTQPIGQYAGVWALRADGTEARVLIARYDVGFGLLVAGWTPDSRSVIYSPDPSFSASYMADGLQWHFAALNPLENTREEDGRLVRTDSIDETIDNEKRVLTYEDSVDFAPDGARMAVVRGGGRDANAGKAVAIIEDTLHVAFYDLTKPDIAATSPDWSPDGRWIAYVQQPAGREYDPGAVNRKRIWLMRPDGSARQPLLDTEAWAERPQWSADGRYILYVLPSASEPSASLVLRRLSDGLEAEMLGGVEYETAGAARNIGYFGHLDWDWLFDWWQPPH
ncbi:MAG TPA: LuxR C-terminal-related transcriptional regulator [Dehalococcoidia bacterium]